jgi:ubiquinol-cytochrome c reductase iron-sulfur subunit
MLVAMLGVAFAGLGAALAVPVLSLGPAPGQELFSTSWRAGKRVVGLNGEPVRADDLAVDSLLTVFPEGAVGSADSQALLIRVPPELLRLDPERLAWAPNGYVVYSKICTHAGCPVGLYRAQERRLICPCHQSTFDVLTGAVPVFGPAGRPLPQLPIRLEADGTFTAIDDFPEAVGPSIWNIRSGDRADAGAASGDEAAT